MILPKELSLDFCRQFVKEIVHSEKFIPVTNVLPADEAIPDSLVFIASNNKNKNELLNSTKAVTVITDINSDLPSDKCIFLSDNPKLTFARIVNFLFESEFIGGIHPSAVIHPKANIHPDAYVGPNCVVGQSCIGSGSRLIANVTIYDNVEIGDNCIIDAGAVIGSAGFGFVRDNDGIPVPFPQLGGVRIGNNVEIGANVCVDRGALKDTIVHDNVKIDNFSQIAHNDEIGDNTLIIGTKLAGSVSVGKNCHIAGLWVMNQKKIGDRVTLGAGSVALSSLRDDTSYMGYPALAVEKFQKIQYKIKKL